MAGMNGGRSMRVGNASDREKAARAANDLEARAPEATDVALRDDVVTFFLPDTHNLPPRVMSILAENDMALSSGCVTDGCVGKFRARPE